MSAAPGAVLLVIGLLRGVLRREVSGSLFFILAENFGVRGAWVTAYIQ